MIVKASAPGKVFLIGEHAVVYGKPGILAAIDRRITAEAEESDVIRISDPIMKEPVQMSIEGMVSLRDKLRSMWNSGLQKRDFSELFGFFHGDYYRLKVAIIAEAFDALDIEGGVSIKISGNIPYGSGLGTSAALAVSIAQAIAKLYDIEASYEMIYNIAYNGEKFIHGTPSGADPATCTYGGLIWFQKGEPNIIHPLKQEIPYELENFFLVYTKPPKLSTGELVQNVRNLEERFRNERVGNIADATHKMREALKSRDFGKVKKMMNLAQKNLKELGVSIPEIDAIAEKAMSLGGAAKLCGAGGGGIMLCYHEDGELLKREINKLGYEVMKVKLGAEGVRIE